MSTEKNTDKLVVFNNKELNLNQCGRIIKNSPDLTDFINYLIKVNDYTDCTNPNKMYFIRGRVSMLQDILKYGELVENKRNKRG